MLPNCNQKTQDIGEIPSKRPKILKEKIEKFFQKNCILLKNKGKISIFT